MFLSRLGAQFGSFTTTRQSVNQLWDFVAFVANSLLFLLVGLAINLGELRSSLTAAGWGIGAIGLARVIAVYGLSALSALVGQRLPVAWQHVFFIGGLRGALSMALVLSLPASLEGATSSSPWYFSVVLFTIVAQGLAIAPALLRLRLSQEQAAIRS